MQWGVTLFPQHTHTFFLYILQLDPPIASSDRFNCKKKIIYNKK